MSGPYTEGPPQQWPPGAGEAWKDLKESQRRLLAWRDRRGGVRAALESGVVHVSTDGRWRVEPADGTYRVGERFDRGTWAHYTCGDVNEVAVHLIEGDGPDIADLIPEAP